MKYTIIVVLIADCSQIIEIKIPQLIYFSLQFSWDQMQWNFTGDVQIDNIDYNMEMCDRLSIITNNTLHITCKKIRYLGSDIVFMMLL